MLWIVDGRHRWLQTGLQSVVSPSICSAAQGWLIFLDLMIRNILWRFSRTMLWIKCTCSWLSFKRCGDICQMSEWFLVTTFIFVSSLFIIKRLFVYFLHLETLQAEAGLSVTVPDPGSKNIKTMTEFDTSWTEMKKPPVKPNTNWNSNKRYLHIFSD